MLPDLNIRSWRDIFTGEFLYSKLEQAPATWQLEMFFPVSKPEKTGGTHIKVTVMLFVSLLGLNCRFWSHLGCLGWKVLYLPIQVSLSTGHKEISKKECPDTDHPGGGGGTPMNSCWGCAARFSTSLPYFRSKHVTPVFRPGL